MLFHRCQINVVIILVLITLFKIHCIWFILHFQIGVFVYLGLFWSSSTANFTLLQLFNISLDIILIGIKKKNSWCAWSHIFIWFSSFGWDIFKTAACRVASCDVSRFVVMLPILVGASGIPKF